MSSREVGVGVKQQRWFSLTADIILQVFVLYESLQTNLFLFYKKTGEILRLIDSYVGGFKDPQVSGLERKNQPQSKEKP